MRRLLASLFFALFGAAALPAAEDAREEVVLGLSQNRVAITADFDGSEILIFGAVKRETPIPDSEPLEVIVTVAGPSSPVTVRRKEQKFGIWVNVDSVLVDSAPSFYAVATSGPFTSVLTDTEDLRHRVSIKRAIRSVGAAMNIRDAQDFADAVVRIRQEEGLYSLRPDTVVVDQQTLFRTAIEMPSNLTEGTYTTRVLLTRGGAVVSTYETDLDVRKVGLERFLYALSRQKPFLYGIMSLVIAVLAGWGASAGFQLLRER